MSNGLRDKLEPLMPAYLSQQRWFAGSALPPDSVRVERARVLWAANGHRLWHAIAAVMGTHYQLLIGERPAAERADFLHGRDEAILGSIDGTIFYDAVLDSELAPLLEVASGGARKAALARPDQHRAIQHLARVRRSPHSQALPPAARRP